MTVRLATATRNALTAAATAAIDAGPAGGTIDVRTGTQPLTANDAATGTLLLTWTLDATASFGAPTAGIAELDATPVITTTGLAAGTAGWARIKDSTGATVLDIAVGTELSLDNAVVAVGQTVNLTVGTITTTAS